MYIAFVYIALRRSGLVVSTSDTGPDDPGSSLGVAHENFCVASLTRCSLTLCLRPTQPGFGKIGEWAMCLRIERWPGALDKL